MSRYETDIATVEACVETPKMLKKRIKQKKTIIEDFFKISNFIEMNWKEKQAVIGGLYSELREMKLRLKRILNDKKNMAK